MSAPTAVEIAGEGLDELLLAMKIGQEDPSRWPNWLRDLLPEHFRAPFAPHHLELIDWIFRLTPGLRPRPFIAVWGRGGAKSTFGESACVITGARYTRRYALYVSATQDLADKHVDTIGSMLTSRAVTERYQSLSRRSVGLYGHSRGWRRNRLRTSAGLTVDALGFDTAARGLKDEEQRPDFIILDDIDSKHDGPRAVEKKIETLTTTILPAGSDDVAVLAIQNLIHPDSIFSQLVDGRADFLADRTLSGPVPAVDGLVYERTPDDVFEATRRRYVIIDGRATWEGFGIGKCEEKLNDVGPTAFLSEYQHDVEPAPGGMYDELEFEHVAPEDVPQLDRVVVWVDPAVTDTDESDSQGLQADGIAGDTIYRLRSWEGRTSPLRALKRAIRWAYELSAHRVGVETDQGGDTWRSVYREALAEVCKEDGLDPDIAPAFASQKAGAGHGSKVHRSSHMLADYERGGRIIHVHGTDLILERALRRFPKTKPLDLADAAYWSWRDLRGHKPRRKPRTRSIRR